MSWPRDPSRDLVSHHIQQHSTKSTNRTYLLPCSWRLTFLIYQTPFIYYWELAFLYRIIEKRISRYSSVILLQFRFLLINIPFVGTRPFFFWIRWDSDHPTKSCDWWRPTEQNQPRMALTLGGRDSSSKRRCQALGNLRDEAQDARHTGRSKARLPGVFSTLLQEKLVAPMSL